jgi:hypothetical protein
MNIQAIRAYSEPVIPPSRPSNVVQKQELKKTEQTSTQASQAKSGGNQLITPKEREFFMKMFPDSSSQIEKHILFNRNGRLQTQSFNKGLIVDSRV